MTERRQHDAYRAPDDADDPVRGDPSCAASREAVAWLQGELEPRAARGFEAHLRTCAGCRGFVDDARRLLGAVSASERLARRRSAAPAVRARTAALAAAFALVVVGLVWTRLPDADDASRAPGIAWSGDAAPPTSPAGDAGFDDASARSASRVALEAPRAPGPDAEGVPSFAPRARPSSPAHDRALVVPTALAVVEARLASDVGRADAARADDVRGLGAQRVGVHGLALLALARGAREAPDADRRARVLAAARRLAEAQDADGLLGSERAGGYDHPVATLALLEAWELTGDDALRTAADRAVAHLVASGPSRGLAWDRDRGREAWTRSALLRARTLGWRDVDAVIGPDVGRDHDLLADAGFWDRALPAGAAPRADADPLDLLGASLAVLRAGSSAGQ